jgi:hypothetical protein
MDQRFLTPLVQNWVNEVRFELVLLTSDFFNELNFIFYHQSFFKASASAKTSISVF